ncbi:MAG: DNA translocase FtsK [Akkermansiaceae bacterium]
MAAQNKSKRTNEVSTKPSWFNEVVGIGMIGFGILLLLALISFDYGDVPEWFYGRENDASRATSNMIGILGAIIAWVTLLLFGAAAFLISLGVIWLGTAYAFMEGSLTRRTWIGFICFVVIGACLLSVGEFWSEWARLSGLRNSGGVIGYFLGTGVFEKLLNKTGAVIVLFVGYVAGLIMLTGLNPIKFTKLSWQKFITWKNERAERLALQREKDNAKQNRRAERSFLTEQRIAAKEETKLESDKKRALTAAEEKKKAAEELAKQKEEEAKNPQTVMALKETPKPQIIDSAQRKRPMAEVGAKPFEKKKKDPDAISLSTNAYEDYETPGFDLLSYDESAEEEPEADKEELIATQKMIVDTLKAFGVDVSAGDITRGPTITRYEVYPSMGLRVSRITQLEADLARATKAERINILAPIPGKDTVGIEIANDKKVAVPLRELVQDPEFTSSKKKIPLALGKDVYGNTVIGDLAAMPHLLVAGATGAGKSVCINSIITSILFKFSPDELRFIMVDPKVVEMQIYGKLPHLVVPVVTDPAKVVAALRWVVNEMEKRYKMFAKCGVRNFDGYNDRPRPEKEAEPETPDVEEESEEEPDPEMVESIARALEDGELGPPMEIDEDELEFTEDKLPDRIPYIVVIIDELADLMQTAPADVEMNIARIAQKARAAGIHLIIATQTPRADVVTGIIKANIPSRIAFQVSSALDSRVILDTKGADKLVGKGDMLYLPPGSAKLERAQGAFVSDEEVEAIVEYCSQQGEQKFEKSIQESIEKGGSSDDGGSDVSDADEEVIQKCLEVIHQEKKASTSLLQRRLRLGYTRAARMMDILEDRGIIGPADGAKAREILIDVGE